MTTTGKVLLKALRIQLSIRKTNSALVGRSVWVLQEADAESQLGTNEVHVCVGWRTWWNVYERYRGRKQNWARKLSDGDADEIPVNGKREEVSLGGQSTGCDVGAVTSQRHSRES